MRPRMLRNPSSRLIRRLHPEGSSPAFADEEPGSITPPATSVPDCTRSSSGVGTVGTLLYLAVVGLVAIALSASFGGFFFLMVRANGTIAFTEPNRAHSPQSNPEPAPVVGGARGPTSTAAAAISGLPPALRATASVTPLPPPAPRSAPSVKMVPGLEQGGSPSNSPTANPSPTAEQGSVISQGTINTPARQESPGADYRPNRNAGSSQSVQSQPARSPISHRAYRPSSSGRLATHVTKKTRVVGETNMSLLHSRY
jgi:hypothetical protein